MNYVATMQQLKQVMVKGDLLLGCSDTIKMICELERLGELHNPTISMGYGNDQLPDQVRFQFRIRDHDVEMIVGQDGEAKLVIQAISPGTVGAYLCTICQPEEPLLTERQFKALNLRRLKLLKRVEPTTKQQRELDALQRIVELYLRPLDNKLMEGLATLERTLTEETDDPSSEQPDSETELHD